LVGYKNPKGIISTIFGIKPEQTYENLIDQNSLLKCYGGNMDDNTWTYEWECQNYKSVFGYDNDNDNDLNNHEINNLDSTQVAFKKFKSNLK